MKGNTAWRLFLSVAALAAAVFYIVDRPVKLGLDLKGGTQVVLDLRPRPGQPLTSDVANRTLEVLRKRVDSLGVSEPNLAIDGDKRIIVELPGVENPDEAVKVIGSTAQLTIHPVIGIVNPQSPANQSNGGTTPSTTPAVGTTAPLGTPSASTAPPTTSAGLAPAGSAGQPAVLGQATPASPNSTPQQLPANEGTPPSGETVPVNQTGAITAQDERGTTYSLGPAALTGEGIGDARANPPDQNNTSWYLTIDFKGAGAKAWTTLTAEEACKPEGDPSRQSAFVLDGRIIQVSGPASSVQCGVGITGNTTEVTGSFAQKEVRDLALLIRGGALPVDVKIASQQVVGPELGKSAIEASRNAVIIGGALTVIYILVYYRLLGLIAALSLGAYGVISYAVLIGLNLTLTLPGIAGFVLAIGMAMDSNVLVYERVKEELAAGRTMRSSSQLGFKNALSAIIDSNATTAIAAMVLFFFAVGAVKGFGITLLVGTAVSIFVTLVLLRTLIHGLLRLDVARRHPGALGMYVGQKFRRRMNENPPDIIGISKYFLAASGILLLIGIGAIVNKGINYGIEFTGGRLIEYKTAQPVDVERARTELEKAGIERAKVQRSGREDTSVRIAALTSEQSDKVEQVMKDLGGGSVDTLRDDNIGPSFGDELKRKAFIGLGIGIAAQLIYVAFRFRWTFGIGAVVGMLHDALLVLGLWALLQKPFDAVFLAALLTIIAYSVNDSVVVFDRIREQRRRRSGEPFARVVSDACAQTFPRTVNLSVSAVFILGALYFLGGQTLGDFALALLLGVITGVYSSVLIASPVATLLERWSPGVAPRSTSAARRASPARVGRAQSVDAASGEDNDAIQSQSKVGAANTRTPANRPPPRPRSKPKKKRRR